MATVLDEFLPMNVSGVRPGHGSFFTIDLSSDTGEPRYLWIYLCGWIILNGQDSSINSDSAKLEIDRYLLRWKPSELVSTKINNKIEIDFRFDNSRLRLFPYPNTYGRDADLFRLFEKDKMYYLKFKDKEIRETPSDGVSHGEVDIGRRAR